LAARNLIRIGAVAVALSTLSFAAGVAGDLSAIDPPRSGERVVLRLPPEIPAGAVRARPLPPLLSTASAEARPAVRRVAYRLAEPVIVQAEIAPRTAEPKQKPRHQRVRTATAKANVREAVLAHEHKHA
jgi:hypothetical protein